MVAARVGALGTAATGRRITPGRARMHSEVWARADAERTLAARASGSGAWCCLSAAPPALSPGVRCASAAGARKGACALLSQIMTNCVRCDRVCHDTDRAHKKKAPARVAFPTDWNLRPRIGSAAACTTTASESDRGGARHANVTSYVVHRFNDLAQCSAAR